MPWTHFYHTSSLPKLPRPMGREGPIVCEHTSHASTIKTWPYKDGRPCYVSGDPIRVWTEVHSMESWNLGGSISIDVEEMSTWCMRRRMRRRDWSPWMIQMHNKRWWLFSGSKLFPEYAWWVKQQRSATYPAITWNRIVWRIIWRRMSRRNPTSLLPFPSSLFYGAIVMKFTLRVDYKDNIQEVNRHVPGGIIIIDVCTEIHGHNERWTPLSLVIFDNHHPSSDHQRPH